MSLEVRLVDHQHQDHFLADAAAPPIGPVAMSASRGADFVVGGWWWWWWWRGLTQDRSCSSVPVSANGRR